MCDEDVTIDVTNWMPCRHCGETGSCATPGCHCWQVSSERYFEQRPNPQGFIVHGAPPKEVRPCARCGGKGFHPIACPPISDKLVRRWQDE